MYQLIYVSSALTPFSRQQLLDLLTHSRASNSRNGLTGMLLYKDGNFLQVLEGERAVVEDRFERIRHDPRHKDVIVIESGEVSAREFADWSMGFRDLSALEASSVPGYSSLMNKSLVIEEFAEQPSAAKELLLMFAS